QLVADALSGIDTVVYAPGGHPDSFDAASGYGLFDIGRRLCVALTAMALPPRLFVVTRNAQPISEGDRVNPAHAVLWGLGRTLALEHPEIWGGVIDVDEVVPAGVAARYAVSEVCCGDGEDQVVYRAGVRRVARLQRAALPVSMVDELDRD